MNSVFSAGFAEFSDLKLVRLSLFVTFGRIVSVLTFRTAKKDNLSHVTFTFCDIFLCHIKTAQSTPDGVLRQAINSLGNRSAHRLSPEEPGIGTIAHNQNRTGDLQLTMLMLYRLSYVGGFEHYIFTAVFLSMF